MALRVQDSTIVRDRDGTLFSGDTDSNVRSRGVGTAASYASSISRDQATADLAAAASGTLRVVLAVFPAGRVVNGIAFHSGTVAAVAPTAQWAALYAGSAGGARLGVTADRTTAAWAANAEQEYTLTAPISFATDTPVYIALLVVGGTVPTLRGATGEVNLNTLAPIRAGTADAGLTTPATAPATLGTVTAGAPIPFATLKP